MGHSPSVYIFFKRVIIESLQFCNIFNTLYIYLSNYHIIKQFKQMQQNKKQMDGIDQKIQNNCIIINQQISDQQCEILSPNPFVSNNHHHSLMKDEKQQQKAKKFKQKKDNMFVGSLLVIGSTNYDIKKFHQQRQLSIDYSTKTTLHLIDWTSYKITVQLILANYVHEIILKGIANIRFFYHLEENRPKKNVKGVIFFPIRMDIYVRERILNPQFYNQLLNNISLVKQDQEQIFQRVKCCQMLIYLIKKCGVKVINRSLVVPPPKINLMMRSYRTETIGHKTKSSINTQRINHKIKQWKQRFQKAGQYHPCISLNNIRQLNQTFDVQEYYRGTQQLFFKWEERQDEHHNEIYELERIKNIQASTQSDIYKQEIYDQNLKKILKEIGANIFIQRSTTNQMSQIKQNIFLDQQQQNYDQQINRKNNIQLLRKFEQENKFFRIHPTPSSMLSQLKPYQGQALQWMKKREGKLQQSELFEQHYQHFQQFQKERNLSIFWQEVQLITGQIIFYNFLTGQFSKQFKEGKTIKGGILADQMGLGKTVMMLALLADQDFQGTNLIVLPVTVLKQWQKQIKVHCGQTIKVLNYNEKKTSQRKTEDLQNYNIVLVTYNTLAVQFKSYRNSQNRHKSLFDYKFRRIILDQAHQIREIGTLKFNATMSLRAEFKWCLTGTLVQNSEKDLFPILKFLQIQFFSQQQWWNKYIKNSVSFQSKLNILYTILRSIILRRTKDKTLLSLPSKHQHRLRPYFSSCQQKIYKQLQKGAVRQLDLNMKGDKNYIYAFCIINKLRQFCCHPKLVIGDYRQVDLQNKSTEQIIKIFFSPKLTDQYKDQVLKNFTQISQNCTICLQKPDESMISVTKCGHFFCLNCITSNIEKGSKKCPICRASIEKNDIICQAKIEEQKQIMKLKYDTLSNAVQNSSKMKYILDIVDQVIQRDQKCVIFTQWLCMIALLQNKLSQKSVKFGTVKGSMSSRKRQKQIQEFRNNKQCQILIVSIRAGNTGINLQVANNVIICDPWWNPNQQDQAIGRVHRIGQQKQVNVYRLYMKDSIEQKIQKLHAKKRTISQQIMMNQDSLSKKNMDIIEQLLKLMKEE